MSDEKSQVVGTYVMAAQVVTSFLLLAISSVANGLLLFLLARFKTLQTTSNILVVDLAVIDLLNVLINVPVFICYGVLDLNAFRGRITAWLVSTFHVLFAYLTLTTMFLMMIYRFLAIRFPVHYQAGKTKRRILIAIVAKWLFSFIAVYSVYAFLYKIDLGNCSVLEYRATYNIESKAIIPRILSPPILLASVSMYLVCWKTLKSHHRRAKSRAQSTINGRRNHKAINTILIVIVIFCVSYLPEIVRSIWALGLASANGRQWLLFVLNLVLFLPSTVNPFIYFVRVESYRHAFIGLFAQTPQTDPTDIRELRATGNMLRKERMLQPSGNNIQKSGNAASMDSNQSTTDTGPGENSAYEAETKS